MLFPNRMIASISGGNPVYLINPAEGKGDSVLSSSQFSYRDEGMEEIGSSFTEWHYGTNPRIPEIVAVADSSWSLGTRADASSIKGGAHGYDNSNSDMFSIFYAAGPSFKKSYKFKELE